MISPFLLTPIPHPPWSRLYLHPNPNLASGKGMGWRGRRLPCSSHIWNAFPHTLQLPFAWQSIPMATSEELSVMLPTFSVAALACSSSTLTPTAAGLTVVLSVFPAGFYTLLEQKPYAFSLMFNSPSLFPCLACHKSSWINEWANKSIGT